MRVLMVTGDKNLFIPGTEAYVRLELQRRQVDELELVFWGRGSILPAIPRGRFDIVTAQDPFWRGLFAWYVARKKNARLNVQIHADLGAQPFFRRLLARIVLRYADSVRVVSERIKRQVMRYTRAPISVLPVFVDVLRFKHLSREPRSTKIILWTGRFEEEKDPLRAILVLQDVLKEGVTAKLIMLGAGSLEKKLREAAKSLPVEFPGWQDTRKYLSQANVLLNTSRYESWGASIVEALAAGVPVVAPDVGIAHEAGAIVVPRERLAEAVIDVLRSKARGELKLNLPSADEWGQKWRESL